MRKEKVWLEATLSLDPCFCFLDMDTPLSFLDLHGLFLFENSFRDEREEGVRRLATDLWEEGGR